MVTAPKCKVCGSAHFGAAHVWPSSGSSRGSIPQDGLAAIERELQRAADRSPTGMLVVPVAAPDILAGRVKLPEMKAPKRDRAAYMRAYRLKKGKAK